MKTSSICDFSRLRNDCCWQRRVAKALAASIVTGMLGAIPALAQSAGGDQELHVVGIYEGVTSTGGSNHAEGKATVAVDRPGKRVTLVLSSYEPVAWEVTVAAGTAVERVILAGYYRQQVQGVSPEPEVIPAYYDERNSQYFWVGYSVDSGRFLQSVPRINAMTGLELSSFQGAYRAPYPSPFVIDTVQDDLRLRSDYPQCAPPSELPQLSFSLTFYTGQTGGGGSLFVRNYTLAGPEDGGVLLPRANRVVSDASQQDLYGVTWQGVLKVDALTGQSQSMTLDGDVPELSWPMGLTYDSKRGRVLLVSLGGEGYLYAYSPAQQQWSVVSSMAQMDLDSLVYHPGDDSLYGMKVCHGDSCTGQICRFDAGGNYQNEVPLGVLPFGVGFGPYRSQLVAVGDYLVVLLGPDPNHPVANEPRESRMYLVHPQSNQVWLTYRSASGAENKPPSVQMTWPGEGAVLPAGKPLRLVAEASDSDGAVRWVEFFANGQSLGKAQRSSADSAGSNLFSLDWPDVSAGSYRLTAKATDGQGAATTSGAVGVTVQDEPVVAPADERELHVVGIYEGVTSTGSSGNHAEGQVAVVVSRPGKRVTLVLSSFEPANWSVTVVPGTTLERVILAGFYAQRAEGLAAEVEVVPAYRDGQSDQHLYVGYLLESSEFWQSVPKIKAMTDQEIASFRGAYRAPYPEAFAINSVQNDVRLRSDYPQPTSPAELPPVSFQLAFYSGAAGGAGSLFFQNYTFAGPAEGAALLPRAARVAPDASHQYYYDLSLLKIDGLTAAAQEIPMGSTVPELSWPMGLTYDSKRDRVLLVSLGGEGYLYAYSPAAGAWSVVSSMNNRDLDCLVYHASEDALYGLEVYRCYGTRPLLYRLSAATGVYQGEFDLPGLPYSVGPSGYRSELISVGDYLVLLLGPKTYWSAGGQYDCRMYVIEPKSRQVWLTYRSTANLEQANKPPTVQLTWPGEGMSLPLGAPVRLEAEAADADGMVESVEFFANDQSLGKGRRSTANGAGSRFFSLQWENVPAGEYHLKAKATDGQGAITVSTTIQITVAEQPPPEPGDEPELHVIAIYGNGGGNHSESPAAVVVSRPGKRVTLFLSAYEPVLWQITVAPDTVVERAFLAGYYAQKVQGLGPEAQVFPCYYAEGANGQYLWLGTSLESASFFQNVPRINALTGLEISSFQGGSVAPYPRPFVVNAVQNDIRLRSDYPQPSPLSALPQLSFELAFSDAGGSVSVQPYTLAGGPDSTRLMPAAMRVVPDSGQRFYYGTFWHVVYQVDSVARKVQEMSLNSGVPELSWPMGMAYDSKRDRVLLASLGGEGFLYAYSPAAQRWSVVASMDNRDVNCLVYHAADDCLYALQVLHSDGGAPLLYRLSAEGAYLGELRLPVLPFSLGPGGGRSELVSVDEYLVLLVGPETRWSMDPRQEFRMYLIDPRSHQVWLTYRSTGVKENKPPLVQITWPTEGMLLPLGSPMRLTAEATDPDGSLQAVEFFANGQSLGRGQRSPAGLDGGKTFYLDWTGALAGAYSLRAQASDERGARTDSAAVNVTVIELTPFAFRHLPPAFFPGVILTVMITVPAVIDIDSYIVEDQPPEGWTVTAVSDGGAFDATDGKVKFGPFQDSEPRILTYQIIPSGELAGTQLFSGEVSADGLVRPIAGEEAVEPTGLQHPADTAPSDDAITLAEATAYSASWQKGLLWPVGPKTIPLSYVTRAGALWKHGEAYVFNPSAGESPLWWNSRPAAGAGLHEAPLSSGGGGVRRTVISLDSAGAALAVEMMAEPAAGVAAYAVEERPPKGWTLGEISQGGQLADRQQTIRWGPFFDAKPRRLAYRLTAPSDSTAAGLFYGLASFDGSSDLVTGQSRTTEAQAPPSQTAPRIVLERREARGLTVRFSVPATHQWSVECTDSLAPAVWTPLANPASNKSGDEVSVTVPLESGKQRFYRVKLTAAPD